MNSKAAPNARSMGDIYAVTVTTDVCVQCEAIIAAWKSITTGHAEFQEAITQRLADTLRMECKTVGLHRCGVTTTVTCQPEPCETDEPGIEMPENAAGH